MDIKNIINKPAQMITTAFNNSEVNSILLGDNKGNIIYPIYNIDNGKIIIEEVDKSKLPNIIKLFISFETYYSKLNFHEFIDFLFKIQNLGYKLYFSFCGYMLNPMREEKDILYSRFFDESYMSLPIRLNEIDEILNKKSQFPMAANVYFCINDESLCILNKDTWKMNEIVDDGSILYDFLKKNLE